MEHLLALYEWPYDPLKPVICIDERPCQLVGDLILPLPMQPGKLRREDYEYKREGTCCVFIAVEPLRGWRYLEVRAHRTKVDYAEFMRNVAAQYALEAQLHVVQDNLNTHTAGSFYAAFEPEEAFRLAQHFDFHYTPIHGSWLNMAEIELAALSKQCLDRRIGDQKTLQQEAKAWEKQRNEAEIKIQWRFTKRQARKKFKKKYPVTSQN